MFGTAPQWRLYIRKSYLDISDSCARAHPTLDSIRSAYNIHYLQVYPFENALVLQDRR